MEKIIFLLVAVTCTEAFEPGGNDICDDVILGYYDTTEVCELNGDHISSTPPYVDMYVEGYECLPIEDWRAPQ